MEILDLYKVILTFIQEKEKIKRKETKQKQKTVTNIYNNKILHCRQCLPVVGVGGEDEVAGEDDHQLGEGEVHQQPVDRRLELQQAVRTSTSEYGQDLHPVITSYFCQSILI